MYEKRNSHETIIERIFYENCTIVKNIQHYMWYRTKSPCVLCKKMCINTWRKNSLSRDYLGELWADILEEVGIEVINFNRK